MQQRQIVAVGMVGCGFYAQNHLHAWADLRPEGAILAAVCDMDPGRAKAAGVKFGVPHFSCIETMLEAVPLDLLDIATRMDTHRPLAAIAAELGIAAIVQKPFAPTWEDCIAVVEKARQHNAWLAVHENFRFSTSMRAVKKVLAHGTIGTPRWARLSWRTGFDVYRGQPYLAEEAKLVIQDLGIHILDLARFFLGEVERLSCETQKRNPKIRAEDTATIMMRHTSGAVSVVEATYAAKRGDDPFPETLLEIEGDEGSLILSKGEKLTVTTQGLTFEDHVGGPLLHWTSRPWHASQEAVLHTNRHMFERFRLGLAADTSGEDNLKTYALVEAAYEAAASHASVKPKAHVT
ncbi:Gfo/Idh/MocA family oxidoreductase [Aestuariivirga sp.]|jgi:predicted dehydrogenase|uniref:Gfo/Idh/MocA family protein n=1 Tax=Aestuariivirga sp. TaxID=2650926 RepID=UPI003784FEC0